jgi:RNA polymerase sigma-70 factor (ECF subfamily)
MGRRTARNDATMLEQSEQSRASRSKQALPWGASFDATLCPRRGTSEARFDTIAVVSDRFTVHHGKDLTSRVQRSKTAEVVNKGGGRAEELDETALARAGILGQEWAQREIWYRFAPMVYALLRRSLGLRHETEDLLQEVFLRVFGRLSTLENPSALRSFVYSFAVRVVSEEIRRHRVRSRLTALFLAPATERSTPHVDFESRELLGRIQRVLDKLNDRVRVVFVLRRFDGVALTEIASGLGLSLATVKRDLDKANAFIAHAIRRDDRLRAGLGADSGVESEP